MFFPTQLERREELLRSVTSFWETHVKDRLAGVFDRCVVDFAVLRDGRVMVIELNPFDTFTGMNA